MVRHIPLLLAVLTLLVFSGCRTEEKKADDKETYLEDAGKSEPENPDAAIIVYTTEQGEKYHREDCPHLRSGKKEITLKKAKERGYTPCKTCNPPE